MVKAKEEFEMATTTTTTTTNKQTASVQTTTTTSQLQHCCSKRSSPEEPGIGVAVNTTFLFHSLSFATNLHDMMFQSSKNIENLDFSVGFSTVALFSLLYLWKTTESFLIPNTGRHLLSTSSSDSFTSPQAYYYHHPGFQLFAENAADIARGTKNVTVFSSPPANASPNDETSLIVEHVREAFPEGEILTFKLIDHRPLGCTVEESLNKDDEYVFISKITTGGNAEKAGLRVGDVVVGVTGLFGGITIVMESGVDKITRLVSSVPQDNPLTLQIVRGTNVLERHETAIVDMCNMSGASEKEVENCVVDFLAGGYDEVGDNLHDQGAECGDDDTECLIDDMMNLWADEVPLPPTTSGIADQVNGENSAKKPKPWSSRSSPSGTWVRDPKTGQMRNIDG